MGIIQKNDIEIYEVETKLLNKDWIFIFQTLSGDIKVQIDRDSIKDEENSFFVSKSHKNFELLMPDKLLKSESKKNEVTFIKIMNLSSIIPA